MQVRKLPENIRELLLMWEVCDQCFATAAKQYGVDESSVRHRLNAYLKSIGVSHGNYRKYSKLPLDELDLAQKRGSSWVSLAREYGVDQNSLRKAVVRYRKRKEREE